MKDEYTVTKQIRKYVSEHINQYINLDDGLPLEELSDKQILIDSPDVDNMVGKTTIYFEHDNGNLQEDTLLSDTFEMSFIVTILSTRDMQRNLQEKVWGYYSAFYVMARLDQTFGGAVDYSIISNWEFYPLVTAEVGTAGIQFTLSVTFQKDYGTEG